MTTTKHPKLVFIGGGNMACAIFANLLLKPANFDIVVTQRNPEKIATLKQHYANNMDLISFIPSLNFSLDADDIVILAIKPQDAKEACYQIKDKLHNRTTIVSLIAGVSINSLSEWLNNNPNIVRTMPNTPSSLGLGVTGVYFSQTFLASQDKIVQIFNSIGKTYILNNEDDINKITATAGSAPAYIFYFAECMIEAAVTEFGFSQATAHDMLMQVLRGSIAMLTQSKLSPQELRSQVTSKKGTTEQAILAFEQSHLKDIIKKAENACYNRAQELSLLYN